MGADQYASRDGRDAGPSCARSGVNLAPLLPAGGRAEVCVGIAVPFLVANVCLQAW